MAVVKVSGIVALMVAAFLSGCTCDCPPVTGQPGDPVDPADPDDPEEPEETEDELASMLTDASLMADRVDALSVTFPAGMPQSGSATYSGYGTLFLDIPDGDLSLLGEATLTANFDSDSISGRVDDFLSGTNDSTAEAFDGRLRIRGDLDGAGFNAEIEGTIDSDVMEIEVAGDASGDFLGSTGAAIGLNADDASVTFLVNGEPVSGSLVVVAED